jgi:hypothetical protein
MLGDVTVDLFGAPVPSAASKNPNSIEELVVGGDVVRKDDKKPREMQRKLYWEILNGTKAGRYNLISAVHKEIRRCDVERGMALGFLFGVIYGFPRLKQYIKSIVLEESRDKMLLDFLSQRMKPEEVMSALHWFLATKKKWHLESRNKVYRVGYTLEMILDTDPIPFDSVFDLFRRSLISGDAAESYRVFWGVLKNGLMGDEGGWGELAKAVKDVFPEEPYLTGFHGIQSAIELSVSGDMWDGGTLGGVPDGYTPPIKEYPVFRRYVFDRHTAIGKTMMLSNVDDLIANGGESKKVDLRWSGVTMGCVWREVAGQSFGPDDMRDRSWVQVEIPSDLWDMAVLLDRMTEPKIFGPWRGSQW